MSVEDEDLENVLANLSIDGGGRNTISSKLEADGPEPSDNTIQHDKQQHADQTAQSPQPQTNSSPAGTLLDFGALLESLSLTTSDTGPKAVAILSPWSYKHIFARPWVAKKYLSSIVERPERLNACAVGIGAALTVAPLEVVESLKRTSLYADHVVAVHGKDWATTLYDLCASAKRKHVEGELEVPDHWPSGDIYLAPESAEALEGVVAALELGVDTIFSPDGGIKRAFVCVRPPGHHCHEDAASGFCLINNAHIAIQYARSHHAITHAAILDFDLHHGDGSQDLCWKFSFNNEGKGFPIGYFSLHDINSYPTERGFSDASKLTAASACLMAHEMAIWNVHLEDYTTEEDFNRLYDTRYSALFKKAVQFLDQAEERAFRNGEPYKALIVISAGFDGSEYETGKMQRHNVRVPTSFFNRFTLDCCSLATRYSGSRVLSLLEGGYSTEALATGIFSHLTGLCEITWESQWSSANIAEAFAKGTRTRWKKYEEFPGVGIQLGRTLFPSNSSVSAKLSPETESKLRSGKRR